MSVYVNTLRITVVGGGTQLAATWFSPLNVTLSGFRLTVRSEAGEEHHALEAHRRSFQFQPPRVTDPRLPYGSRLVESVEVEVVAVQGEVPLLPAAFASVTLAGRVKA